MKNIIFTLVITLMTLASCKAQQIVDISTFNTTNNNGGKYFKDLNNSLTPFLGVWEWQNGNQIFRVTLWKVVQQERENGDNPSYFKDEIKGHYELVQQGQAGGAFETTIYTSQKKIGNSITDWPPVIIGNSINGTEFGGAINDNSVPDNPSYPLGVRGSLELSIIQGSIPIQMEWKVTLPQGLYGDDQPTDFNIPTDVILTKMN